jgi:hypothetical protein
MNPETTPSNSNRIETIGDHLEFWLANWSQWVKFKIKTAERTYTWRNTHPTRIHCYFYDCGQNDVQIDLLKTRADIEKTLLDVLLTPNICLVSIRVRHRTTLESMSIPIYPFIATLNPNPTIVPQSETPDL